MSGDEEHDPKRSVLTALAANTAIAVAKAVAGLLSGSAAMLAEALHSIADTGNQILLLVGLRRSERPPDAEHPFGYGRERYVWTFLVAVNLFALGAAFSIYNGIHGLIAGHELPDPAAAYVVLVLAAGFEGYALRTAYKQFSERRPPGRSLWGSVRESKDPEILTVLGEDSAAISGLLVAGLGIALSEITGDAAFDAAASIGVGLILGAVAFLLGREIQTLIIGEAASPETNRAICRVAAESEAVTRVVELRTLHAGPDELLVVLEIVFADELTSDDIEAAIDDIEDAIRDEVPQARRIYIEPESERPPEEGAAASPGVGAA